MQDIAPSHASKYTRGSLGSLESTDVKEDQMMTHVHHLFSAIVSSVHSMSWKSQHGGALPKGKTCNGVCLHKLYLVSRQCGGL